MKTKIQKLSDSDNILSYRSEEVVFGENEITEIIKEMKEALSFSGGVGISAVQIGINKRIFIIKTPKDQEAIICINPSFEGIGRRYLKYEGCLSVDDEQGWTKRFDEIKVSYKDEKNNKHENIRMTGLHAHVFQHEYDHLEGLIFTNTVGYIKFSFFGVAKYIWQKLAENFENILNYCSKTLNKKSENTQNSHSISQAPGYFENKKTKQR